MRSARRARFFLAAALCLAGAGLWAQSQGQTDSSDDDLNGLFNDGEPSPSPPSTGPQAPTQPSAPAEVRPDDLTRDDKIHVFGSLDIFGDLGGGWSPLPDPNRLFENLRAEGGGSLAVSFGFEVRPVTELRIRAKLSYNFPGPAPLFSEMIVDYSLWNSVFFRVGIFDYTWGNSQFFQFGNLPTRGLPGWSTSNLPYWEQTNLITTITTPTVPVSAKMNIPFGLGGLTFIARFDMANYGFPDQYTPNPRYAGYGLQYDLVTGPIEWSLAGFYQYLLTPRCLLAMKTSMFGFDLSAETTMAFPVTFSPSGIKPIGTSGGGISVGGTLERIYPTAVIGLSREWEDVHIKLHAEYGYNGERDPGTSWLQDQTGPGGHSSALAVRFGNLGPSGLALNLLWQQSWSDWSCLLAPFLELSPVPLTTIQIGLPVIIGSEGSEVLNNRLVPGGKQLELLILVKVSSSFRQ